MTTVTRDSISLRGSGVVSVTQPASGSRFTLDSLLLADFCRIKPRDIVLEPGTGTGVVSLLLAKKFPGISIVSIETQARAADLCRENISVNGLDDRILLLKQDLREIEHVLKSASFDVVVANPPYLQRGAGRPSPLQDRLLARSERLGTIQSWLDLRSYLRNKGRYFLVFPASRSAEMLSLLRAAHLEPKRARFVHPTQGRPAHLILIEAIKSASGGMEVLSPLVVHDAGGGYTAEMRQIYNLP
jgi:tRNA1Val (adenine37-N6)-methyltransferase